MANCLGTLLSGSHTLTHVELILRFGAWAATRHGAPLPEDIAAAFGVSRATAYRWRNAYCDAYGIEIPPARVGFRFAPPAFPRGIHESPAATGNPLIDRTTP